MHLLLGCRDTINFVVDFPIYILNFLSDICCLLLLFFLAKLHLVLKSCLQVNDIRLYFEHLLLEVLVVHFIICSRLRKSFVKLFLMLIKLRRVSSNEPFNTRDSTFPLIIVVILVIDLRLHAEQESILVVIWPDVFLYHCFRVV